MSCVSAESIDRASQLLEGVISATPLSFSKRLSDRYGAEVYLKREDLQTVRSYKIRGSYNFMGSLSDQERLAGVVCASAGNHAQGVALSARLLQIQAVTFMPETTPAQKINRVRDLGGDWVSVERAGATFDEACTIAREYCRARGAMFVHPFDD